MKYIMSWWMKIKLVSSSIDPSREAFIDYVFPRHSLGSLKICLLLKTRMTCTTTIAESFAGPAVELHQSYELTKKMMLKLQTMSSRNTYSLI